MGDATLGLGLSKAKYRALHSALKAIIADAPNAVPSEKLLVLLGGELQQAAGDGAMALARELREALVKYNIITEELSGHRFSSRGAQWFFEVKCAAPF